LAASCRRLAAASAAIGSSRSSPSVPSGASRAQRRRKTLTRRVARLTIDDHREHALAAAERLEAVISVDVGFAPTAASR
jgi:hypothetical protein